MVQRYPFLLVCAALIFPTQLLVAQPDPGAPGLVGQAADKDLPRPVKQQLDDEIIPVIKTQRFGEFYFLFKPIVEQQSSEVLAKIEKYIAAETSVSAQNKFVEYKLRAIEQGAETSDPQMKPTLARYISAAIVKRVERDLADLNSNPVMASPLKLPEGWRKTELLFWQVHVFKNRLLNLVQLARYNDAIVAPLVERAEKNNDLQALEDLADARDLSQRIADSYRRMVENEAELRIVELRNCEEILSTDSDFENRINAAFATEMHARELAEFFHNFQTDSAARPLLNSPGLAEEMKVLVENCREYGQDVIEKAQLLRVGAHFWLRGRYGAAPLARGLLKVPAALTNEQIMFGLYMPVERPKPIATVVTYDEKETSPGYDRRHYYTWAVEHRPKVSNINQGITGFKSKTRLVDVKPGGSFY